MKKNKDFFLRPLEQSVIKIEIISKYFNAWKTVIVSSQSKYSKKNQKIAYIDFYCGPGEYKDNTPSTPIRILQSAIEDKRIRTKFVSIFNDETKKYTLELKKLISELPNLKLLTYKPQVLNYTINEEIADHLSTLKFVPTLTLVDPWGYKGVSLHLFWSVLKNWGCDCIFFFNYSRVNPALSNPSKNIKKHMELLFGEERASKLQLELDTYDKKKRKLFAEKLILDELVSALKEIGGKYVVKLCFKHEKKKVTSHYLIFVSKSDKGYDIMKSIMYKYSTFYDQGVPSFIVDPKIKISPQFKLEEPLLDMLKTDLLNLFKGKSISVYSIYIDHSVGKRYIKQNYKTAIEDLYNLNKVKIKFVNKLVGKKKITYKDIVEFPE